MSGESERVPSTPELGRTGLAAGAQQADAETCKRCGSHNPAWAAPSPLWNAVMRGGSIDGDSIWDDMVCPTCFVVLAEEAGIAKGWRLEPQVVHVELETVTPTGRTWNDDDWLWLDPEPKYEQVSYRDLRPGDRVEVYLITSNEGWEMCPCEVVSAPDPFTVRFGDGYEKTWSSPARAAEANMRRRADAA